MLFFGSFGSFNYDNGFLNLDAFFGAVSAGAVGAFAFALFLAFGFAFGFAFRLATFAHGFVLLDELRVGDIVVVVGLYGEDYSLSYKQGDYDRCPPATDRFEAVHPDLVVPTG